MMWALLTQNNPKTEIKEVTEMTRMEATRSLMLQWEELHPKWKGKITHTNEHNIPESVFDDRLNYINEGLKTLKFI